MKYGEAAPLLGEKQSFPRGRHLPSSPANVREDGWKDDDSSMDQLSASGSAPPRTHLISNREAFMHVVKGLVGTGILGLPNAFRQAGLLLGPLFTTLVAIMCTGTAYMLVVSARTLCGRLGVAALDYAQTMHAAAMPYSPRGARWLKIILNIFLAITQFGFCCVYVVFISDHVVQIVEACGVNFDHGWSHTDKERIVAACLFVPLALATFIKNLDRLSFLSSAANIVLAFGFIIIYYFTSSHFNLKKTDGYGGPISDMPLVAPVSGWPLFLGTAIYAIEGIGVVLPVENRMRAPSDFVKVLVSAFSVVTVVYVVTGQLGYMCFGENTQGSVTLNLPTAGHLAWLYAVVKLYFIFAIFCTYLIQFYVPLTFLEPPLEKYFNSSYVSYFFRTAIVAITCVLAIAIPDLGDFISLVGSLGGSTLLFIFPVVIYQLTFRRDQSGYRHDRPGFLVSALCVVLLIVGVIGFVLGTYSALYDIIEPSKQYKTDNSTIVV